jgi:hypothetical protein
MLQFACAAKPTYPEERDMAQIFISWSGPDARFVNRLATRLEQEGFSVDEYSRDPAGGSIDRNVRRYVDNAEVALICLSENSVGSDWIRAEVEWCAYRKTGCGLPEMIPLIIDKDKVPEATWPRPLRPGDVRKFYLPAVPTDADIDKLLDTVSKTLRGEVRRVVPAVLLAMTRAEADIELEKPALRTLLEPICQAVGMDWDKGGKALLLQRYGDSSEDFAPFPTDKAVPPGAVPPAGMKIKEIVQESLHSANRERNLKAGKPPLGIWWCTEEVLNPLSPDYPRAIDLWQKGSSIVVIDSISLLDPRSPLYDRFRDLPDPDDASTSALLWVPPYTLHTVVLERITEKALQGLNKLFQRFTRWNKESSPPYLAFDIGTRPTMRRWLHETFFYAAVELLPNVDAVAEMRGQPGGDQRLEVFHR